MHAPVSWLRELADVPADAKGVDIAAALVRVGLEEEGLHGGDIAGPLVVGRVLTVQPEPQKNGKTINWCTVDVGNHGQMVTEGKAQEIVCGAHNFAPGDLVVTVLPGGVLPGGFEISARKTYGHVSNGMICSAAELGLGEDHDGIIVLTQRLGEEAASSLQPGDDAIALLGLGDEVVEVNVTPDRGYCFSLRGIAREFALSTGREFRDPARLDVAEANGDGYAVSLADERPLDGRSGCDRYVARVVRGVDTTATSPQWMQKRLTQVGMRPISLAVDVTNYVMMLLGQPLHAFDLDTLSGSIGTRRARAGEKLTTLDDVERTLDPEDLLIVDGSDTPLAIAGVMGGESSEVSDSTTNVLIEAAHFDPVTVARSSRRHKLTTEASKRFERGVDPAVTAAAAQLAVDLLVEHGGGTADAGVTDIDNRIEREAFDFDVTLPTRYIGLDYSRDEVLSTLRAIGCEVDEREKDVVSVAAATWRPDLTDGPELVEEVARVRGYDQIPSVLPQPKSAGRGLTHGQRVRRTIANTLAHQGLVEVLTYPFIGEGRFDQLGYATDDFRRSTVRIVNPLSDEAPLMRTSILDTLLDALRRNVSRGARDVAVYEVGLVTVGSSSPTSAPVPPADARPDDATLGQILGAVPAQPRHVAFAAAGDIERGGPWGPSRRADASDPVGWALAVGRAIGLELSVVSARDRAPFHPGRCAAITLSDGTAVGHVGELHPKVVAALDLPVGTVGGELDVDVLVAGSGSAVQAHQLSTFPAAHTDVALVVDEPVAAAEVEAALRAGAGESLESVSLFDIYRGDQLEAGRKSLAYRLTFRGDRTLKTDEVSALRDAAVASAASATGAVQR
ncbi:phenylalanyl-tRNA synthetase beta subunit [Janibacter sp. HTCC2649]|uniref:phenylalanine--tRNA ligase subunit beta n=1 Tax=Janibacter sp. HTCC2649 TaxID=313589 RepID=UPI000066EB95|nr:phenylalanine--tRNA ligase subunit beta [Janibacter sp. HTCC2649]EAP99379.1 phenylalanyl-tRNA synthetase beta subunit [Janibacter sp. HTCC2649]